MRKSKEYEVYIIMCVTLMDVAFLTLPASIKLCIRLYKKVVKKGV